MELVLVIICSLACFGAGVFLLKPTVRKLFPTAAIAVYFYFVGIWCMVNHIVSGIWQSTKVMDYIFYSVTVLLALFVVFVSASFGKRSNRQ